jgi:hypothetical protein
MKIKMKRIKLLNTGKLHGQFSFHEKKFIFYLEIYYVLECGQSTIFFFSLLPFSYEFLSSLSNLGTKK